MGIIKRQSVPASIATYIGVLLGYINFMLLLPNIISPNELGLLRLVIAIALVYSQFALVGSAFTLLRFFPYFQDEKHKHHGFLAFILRIAVSGFLVFSVLFFLFQNQIENFFVERSALFVEYSSWLWPLTLSIVLFEVFFFYARALLKNIIPVFFKEVLLRLLQLLCSVALLYDWLSFEVFFICFVATYFIHLLAIVGYLAAIGQLFLFGKTDYEGRASFSKMMRYSFFIFAATIASVYTLFIDTILLGKLEGLVAPAVYSIGFFIATLMQIPQRTMNQVALPIIADAWKENNFQKITTMYRQTSLNQFIIGGFIFLIVWINLELLLSFLPEVYQGARYVVLILCLGRLFDAVTGMNGEILLMSKHVKVNLITNWMLIVLATVLNFLLIPHYGVNGAAIATASSLAAYNLIRITFLFWKYQMQPFSSGTWKTILLLGAAFLLFYLSPATNNHWLNAVYRSIIIGGLFTLAVIAFRISPEIIESWKWIKSMIWKGNRN